MAKLTVKYELFRGTFTTWNTLLTKAAAFGSKLGPDRLINITHSDNGSTAVVTVWYWADPS